MWSLAVQARRIGSPLDVALAVLGPDGKELARNDDLPGTTDAGLEFTVPADGTYQIVVSDMAGKSGSRAAIYRLVVQQAGERLQPATGHPARQRAAGRQVRSRRQGGSHGRLQGADRPGQCAACRRESPCPSNLVIPADKTDLVIPLQAAKDAASPLGS